MMHRWIRDRGRWVVLWLNLHLWFGVGSAFATDTAPPPVQASASAAPEAPRGIVDIGRPLSLDEQQALLSDHPLDIGDVIPPKRPELLVEAGETFLGDGKPAASFRLPTGAIWEPALWVFGDYRTSVFTFDDGHKTVDEWANRLDLYFDLKLSGTERILVGLQPLDRGLNRFTSYDFSPRPSPGGNRFDWEGNTNIQTLLFEGDIGQIFPGLDPAGTGHWDIYFSLGKQLITAQDGLLINCFLTGVAFTTLNNKWFGAASWRTTALYAWQNIDRGSNLLTGNEDDPTAGLYCLFNEADFSWTTMNFDLAYINASDASGRAFFGGLSFDQRICERLNSKFHLEFSTPIDGPETLLVGRGALMLNELSWKPGQSDNVVYLNTFATDGSFSSAARYSLTGGPLGQVGLLFSTVALGQWSSPLSSQADHVAGGSLGYQWFLDEDKRRQIVAEVGGRSPTNGAPGGESGCGLRYQQAIGQHYIVQADAFYANIDATPDNAHGFRLETQVKF